MENFKEIAEKCAAGELYGTIILNDGREFYSKYLSQYIFNGQIVEDFYTIGLAQHLFHVDQIINFIPNNMQEQIKIDIPEGKVFVMEQTEKGVVITWKEKELTYGSIVASLCDKDQYIKSPQHYTSNRNTNQFNKKVEVLCKLINIRNYFGKPTGGLGFTIFKSGVVSIATNYNNLPVFAKKEHAEQAIKMLGDELKYLFEPW